jgi:hypothetical protein
MMASKYDYQLGLSREAERQNTPRLLFALRLRFITL